MYNISNVFWIFFIDYSKNDFLSLTGYFVTLNICSSVTNVFLLLLLLLFFVFCCCFFLSVLFFYLGFLLRTFNSRITGSQGKGEGISLTPHYHFHPLHRHLGISWAITAESSPLHIASSRTGTGNLWFPSASR